MPDIIVTKFFQIWEGGKGGEEREGREKLHVNIFVWGGLKAFKGPLQKSHLRDLSFILQIVQELAGNDNYLLLPLASTL